MRKRRSYTPEQRAQVLALVAGGAAVKRTARETGIPESTVRMWRDDPEGAAPPDVRERAVRTLSEEIDRIRRLYLDRAGDEKAVAQTSGYYAVIAAAKLTEVHRLLEGKATEITQSLSGYLSGAKWLEGEPITTAEERLN
jgi:transposase-like protein